MDSSRTAMGNHALFMSDHGLQCTTMGYHRLFIDCSRPPWATVGFPRAPWTTMRYLTLAID